MIYDASGRPLRLAAGFERCVRPEPKIDPPPKGPAADAIGFVIDVEDRQNDGARPEPEERKRGA